MIPHKSFDEEHSKHLAGLLNKLSEITFIGPAGICGTSGLIGPAGISGKEFDTERKKEEKNNIPSIDEWLSINHGNN